MKFNSLVLALAGLVCVVPASFAQTAAAGQEGAGASGASGAAVGGVAASTIVIGAIAVAIVASAVSQNGGSVSVTTGTTGTRR